MKNASDTLTQDDVFLGIDEEEEDTQADKYMTFRISTETYGIGIWNIREIIEMQEITGVPDVPEFVKGVINLRGKVIPIVDLRLRFSMEERAYDSRTCIIITEIRNALIGFIVDTVEEVIEIAPDNIEPAPNFRGATGRDKYISGMGKIEDHVKILLDVERLLFDEDMNAIHKTVGQSQE